MWKRFDFAPIAIIEPKQKSGEEYGVRIFRDILNEEFGKTEGEEIYGEARDRAMNFSVVVRPDRGENVYFTYAVGLSYPVFSPLKANEMELGNALPYEHYPYTPRKSEGVGFLLEWNKIERIVRAVCERFKGTYAQALTAFNASLTYEENGKTSTTGATESRNTFNEYYRGGSFGESSTPTGKTSTEADAESESVSTSLGGFLDVWRGLGRFNDGEVVRPSTIVVDAIFDALFVEYTPVGDVLVFGDQKVKIWG